MARLNPTWSTQHCCRDYECHHRGVYYLLTLRNRIITLCVSLIIASLLNFKWTKHTHHCNALLTLWSDAKSLWFSVSLLLARSPRLAVSSLFTLLFFCFPLLFLSSGLFPSFGLAVNLLAWWFCAPLPTCALWPQQMLPITVRNMPSISPLILKRLKVHLSLPSSAPFPYGCQPTSTNRQLDLTHR